MTDQEYEINEAYKENADSCGIELNGFWIVKEDNDVEWISLEEI